jgi:Mg-chelatase subunit ChlD
MQRLYSIRYIKLWAMTLAVVALIAAAIPTSVTAQAGEITREEIIHRAQTWVNASVLYNQKASRDGYRTDCSGFVSYAWHLTRSDGKPLSATTVSLDAYSRVISQDQLAPGDILNDNDPGDAGHVVIFEKWANDAHTEYWAYELSASGMHHRVNPYPYWPASSHQPGDYVPRRYTNVRESAVAASSSTLLVLDISGSMGDAWQGGVKIESAKAAATQVLDMIEQESKLGEVSHQVGLATFSSNTQLDLPLTTDYAQARGRVAALRPQARTNIGAALQVANQALGSAPADAKKIILLLSDGMSNEGLPGDQILSGPAQEAANAGTCIYAVGFGDPGELDEELLRQIAARSGCGEYYYASAASQLEQVYIKLRHQSLGKIVAEYSGQVSQGQTASIGTAAVPASQGSMYATLHWPGSALDFIVTDPRGQRVDQNYPGASIAVYARMVYIIVQNPLPGAWRASALGRDVPEGTLNYEAIFSVRERVGPPPLSPVGPIVVMSLLALVAAGGVGYVAVQQSAGKLTPRGAVVQVVRGQAARPFARIGGRRLVIGRDPRCGLVIADPKVSHQHAQIVPTLSGCVLTDLNSTGGTYVNGQRVTQVMLRGGETISLGDSELVFKVQQRR